MKRTFLALLAGLALVALSACESMSSRMSDRFAPVPPQTRMISGSANDVYYATQLALRRLDFTLTRSAAAQGRIEAKGRIIPGDSLGGPRQLLVEITLSGPPEGPTELAVQLRQAVEGDFRAGPIQQPLPQHAFYQALFTAVEQVLREEPKPWLTGARR